MLRIFRSVLVLALVASPAMAQPLTKPGASGPWVYLYNENNDIVEGPVRNNVIPLWPARSCFGWTVAVPGAVRTVKVLEVQQAPGTTRFDVGPDVRVNPQSDRTERRFDALSLDGQVSGSWCVNDADPPGLYKFEIFVDGRQMGEFIFCAARFADQPKIKLDELQCPNKLHSS